MNDHIPAEDFAAYVDGKLRPEKKSALENHFSSCPACLDELVEIVAIRHGRDKVLAGGQGKVPAQFLKLALGEKSKITKPVLPLRLVFEIAAAFVVVVFIGYLFLGGNRFWQTSEGQKPSVVTDKNVSLAETTTSLRDRADARKTKSKRVEAVTGQGLDDSTALPKKENDLADKGLPSGGGKSISLSAQENKLQESAEEAPRPVVVEESLSKKEPVRTAEAPEAVGAVQMDSAAQDQPAAKVMETKAGEAEQNLERQKGSGAGVALPAEAKAKTKEDEFKDEKSALKSSMTARATRGAAQPAYVEKKQDAAQTRKAIAAKKTVSPIHIEGDVVWTDLRNPELLSTWSWMQKGLTFELQIDGAGTVIAVVLLGEIDPLLARQAENEAKKLLFSVSKKKLRRARLVVNELPPNPTELRSPRKGG